MFLLSVYERVTHQNAKNQKALEITYIGKTKQHYQKRIFSVFLSKLHTKTVKRRQKHPLERNSITLPKREFSEFLSLLRRKLL